MFLGRDISVPDRRVDIKRRTRNKKGTNLESIVFRIIGKPTMSLAGAVGNYEILVILVELIDAKAHTYHFYEPPHVGTNECPILVASKAIHSI